MIPSWVQTIITAVKRAVPAEFVGQIELNYFKGTLSNINVKQSYKDGEEKAK